MTEEKLIKLITWATGDDTGMSSNALCRWMLDLKPCQYGYSAPSDAGDRGRCIRLLNLMPEWWDRLDEMAKIPSSKVTFFNKNGMGTREEGWKEQIPLIREERLKANR